ncbi:MAG: peptidyl-prolyl cis-trans isomerase [Myxococcales bacterium]|nr:peptidyl-prolyl cis-trans isomerase [Myxococcales bacterium]
MMPSLSAPVAGVVAALIAFSGCKPERPSDEQRQAEARARVTSLAAATAAGESGEPAEGTGRKLTDDERALVVAKLGDRVITLGDVEKEFASQSSLARSQYASFDKKVEFLKSLVDFELVAAEAQRRGYATEAPVVLAAKQALVERFLATEVPKLALATPVTDAEVERYYENHKTEFVQKELLELSTIKLDSRAEADRLQSELEAAIAADKAKARVVVGDFARRFSKDDATVTRSGDFGFVDRDGNVEKPVAGAPVRAPKAVVDAGYALGAPGSLSKVIEADGAFHLVFVADRRPPSERSLEDAKRHITAILLRQNQDEARDAFIAKLRSTAKVEIDEKALTLVDTTTIAIPRRGDGKSVAAPPRVPRKPMTPPGKLLRREPRQRIGDAPEQLPNSATKRVELPPGAQGQLDERGRVKAVAP